MNFVATGLILSMFLSPGLAEACRISSDQKRATLEENFKRAKSVFVGQISSVKKSKKKSLVTFSILKAWKTPTPKQESITAMTNEPSSCDRMGYQVAPGLICLIFLNSNDVVISNLLDGQASFCEEAKSARAESLVREFDEKFKNFR